MSGNVQLLGSALFLNGGVPNVTDSSHLDFRFPAQRLRYDAERPQYSGIAGYR